MLAIKYIQFEEHGCPSCGCDSARGGSFIAYGEQVATCRHCGLEFFLVPNERMLPLTKIGTGRKNEKGENIVETPTMLTQHPRRGVPKWHYAAPDIRPTEGEYWSPRGIGYDLSGFVKSKQAGERLLEIVKEVLGTERPGTYLDYRENEPEWIQFKFSADEFNLNYIYEKTQETKIITRKIIEEAKK